MCLKSKLWKKEIYLMWLQGSRIKAYKLHRGRFHFSMRKTAIKNENKQSNSSHFKYSSKD